MCGFLGTYNFESNADFLSLLSLSAHRGPDLQQTWTAPGVQLGFNRLSIQDLSPAGAQPMESPQGRYVVVFNGEIYNHLQLREQLPAYAYRGHSDTETITHALEVWGVQKTITALDGMFALGIYDLQSKALWLARDFAGIKPLFYGKAGKSVVFASQYDQVRQHPLFKNAPIDPQVLKLYLQQHFLPAPFGLHQGIRQIRPGEIICFQPDGQEEKLRYWELPTEAQYDVTDAKQATDLIQEALSHSVQQQLLSDVPLGAFLSGGVDSPLVCAAAKPLQPELKVFSIGSDSRVHDESKRAKAFASALGLQQRLWQLNAREVLGYWEAAMQSLHEPLADFSLLPTYLVSRLARKEVTVALSGDGGDELFFGYERFWSIGKNIRFQHWPKLARMGVYGLDKYVSGNRNINSVVLADQQCQAHENLHSRFSAQWLNRIFPDLEKVTLPEEWEIYSYPNSRDERTLIGHMRRAEFYGMMQKTLRKVDLASMQNSLEVRVPFLQKSFIEAALRIDPMLSYGKGQKKQVLKNLMQRAIPAVPDDNVKRGFSIPLSEWIREGLQETFQDRLRSIALQDYGADRKKIDDMLKAHLRGASLKWPLFTLYALPQ